MGTVTLPKLSQTGTNEWADVEDNDKALRDEINGNLDNANIKAAAEIAGTKLASSFLEKIGVDGTSTTRRGSATVATEQTTTSTTWADLATAGPSVTVTCPAGLALCFVSVEAKNSTSSNVRVGIYEATDHAISGTYEQGEDVLNGQVTGTAYTSLPFLGVQAIPTTAGSRTFTLKYLTGTGTATFKNRKLWVVTLGF